MTARTNAGRRVERRGRAWFIGRGPDLAAKGHDAMKLFVLTGAGCSAESGLGTFRDKEGAWARFDPMKLATPEGFADDPDLVHAFYNARRGNLLTAMPNEAHRALARLEAELAARGGALFLCTQNIDDLHERAGSRSVAHMHGELRKARCLACGAVTAWDDDLGRNDTCPACGETGGLRPHIVWFGEMPLYMAEIQDALEEADLFVAIGTSGSVYPAAGFVGQARHMGIRTCEINLEPSDNAGLFDERYYGAATEAVPAWVERVLTGPDALVR
ncbi:NAD-dependent deacetylase [Pseudoxanthobacter soli DSM 19599]|uniref:NAD-dependent protein deacylase n=2 Tax=Pseudoxanthobacter TaxID=433838 RepID=A0A1M7ZNH1_9HYPH|nr:NAD-dependent deacetylase [Pseudoxanthobacter soli DSM 19599]